MLRQSEFVKLRIMVPVEKADEIREVLGRTGAGVQGNYCYCSYSYRGTGRFLPMEGAKPAIGQISKLQAVEEEVIETICHLDIIDKVIQAVKKAHPYEEPAIDIMPRFEIGE